MIYFLFYRKLQDALSTIVLLMTMGVIADSMNLKGKEPEGRTAILNEISNEDTALPAAQNTRDIISDSSNEKSSELEEK